MLSLNDLTLHYGHSQILNGISMQAAQGEVTCVMGTNGVGKTSLIKAISGTHPRTAGTLSLDGQDLPVLPAHKLAHLGVAYVPQGREIFPLMTVKENLETGFVCLPPDEHFIPDHIYDLFPVLKDMTSRRGGDLSGGQQQQLAIARALITKPKLLLLDEPTEGIQPNIIQQIGNVIRLLRDQGRWRSCWSSSISNSPMIWPTVSWCCAVARWCWKGPRPTCPRPTCCAACPSEHLRAGGCALVHLLIPTKIDRYIPNAVARDMS